MSHHTLTTIEGVIDNVTAFWRSSTVQAGVELHVFDHIAAGRGTVDEIAPAEHADSRSLRILMDALCGIGMLDKFDGTYHLPTAVAQALPALARMSPWALDSEVMVTWDRLADAVRQGAPLGSREDYWVNFARATADIARFQGVMAASLVGLEGPQPRVLDIGAGSGGVGLGLAIADDAVTVTALDFEPVLAVAKEGTRELGLEDRVALRAVDVVSAPSLGDGEYELAILGNMLHLFDVDTNRALLRKAAEALAPGGKVLIFEILADEARQDATYALLFAVELMLRTPRGTAHTLPEITSWLDEAGFGEPYVPPSMGYTSTLLATLR